MAGKRGYGNTAPPLDAAAASPGALDWPHRDGPTAVPRLESGGRSSRGHGAAVPTATAAACTELQQRDPAMHPSLRYPHSGPKWWWEREALYDLSENLLDLWVGDDDRPRVEPGDPRKKPTKYWQKVRLHAELLLARPVVDAGADYALTELVHCRSGGERGVKEALSTCVDRYLERVLACSPATGRSSTASPAPWPTSRRCSRGSEPKAGV